jgi:hypothetical protein
MADPPPPPPPPLPPTSGMGVVCWLMILKGYKRGQSFVGEEIKLRSKVCNLSGPTQDYCCARLSGRALQALLHS